MSYERTMRRPFLWDAHGCFPLRPDSNLDDLVRYRKAGVGFLSINIGMDQEGVETTVKVLAGFRKYLSEHPEYVLAKTVEDVLRAQQEEKLAVAFDLEGSEALGGSVSMVSFFYDLGVRQMLLAYNRDNRAAGGCLEGKVGLTEFGRAVVAEMNRVGMVVDVSHMGYRASMETMEISKDPVIFSHSNPRALVDHPRNIVDTQIQACARTGGVIGINGIEEFIGGASPELLVQHIRYIVDKVGVEHVGIGLDFCADSPEELERYLRKYPDIYPPGVIGNLITYMAPEIYPPLLELLSQQFNEADVEAILGGNFLRVAKQVWR